MLFLGGANHQDGFQDSDHDPGGWQHRQMALDMVDCNDDLICTDYFVDNLFYVDGWPYSFVENANDFPH